MRVATDIGGTFTEIGIKVVRGAYMEKENKRALAMEYQSPICPSKMATDKNFDSGVHYMLSQLDVFRVFLGSHNEESTYNLIKIMNTHKIEKNDDRIWFGQLYGMSDNITFNLANEGYLVAKYLPYGPVRDVMPYLIRRAEKIPVLRAKRPESLN